jgi:hypothetical protein
VHSRILLGIAAWLAGASAATGGSLLAVSALGQGMNPAAGEQVSVATVNRALAKEAAERTAAMPHRSRSPSRSPATPPSPGAHRHSAAHRPVPPLSPGTAGGTVLTSEGGTLVASCAGARAYVVSWSPQQGFASSDVVRGPATNAQVSFTNGQLTVTMVVSCTTGVPTATATAVSAWAGDGEQAPSRQGD